MLSPETELKIYVYAKSADMRKGISGPSGIVREEFSADPTDGGLFVFVNRRRDRLKMLQVESGGFWLYYRVLEAGTFEALAAEGDSAVIRMDATQLNMLLAGVSLVASKRRRKRFCSSRSERAA